MTLALDPTQRKPGQEIDRHAVILGAAERAFVRQGFHATTMNDVAEEAGMSAGNLYRYFKSKEAMVEGICTLDKDDRAQSFLAVVSSQSILAAISDGIRTHLLAKPREKMLMILEIWAEAGRNPKIAEIGRAIDADVLRGLSALVAAAKAKGEAVASLDPAFAARLIFTLVGGLFKRRAHEPDFDIEREASMALSVFTALFAGAISGQAKSGPVELN